jgi:hypothetical protein
MWGDALDGLATANNSINNAVGGNTNEVPSYGEFIPW